MRYTKRIGAFFIGVFVVLCAAQSQAAAAVAMASDGSGAGFGASAAGTEAADRLAIANCQQYGATCRVVARTRKGCVAVAWNGIGYATGRGPTMRAAVESATRKCHGQTGVPAGAHVRACSEATQPQAAAAVAMASDGSGAGFGASAAGTEAADRLAIANCQQYGATCRVVARTRKGCVAVAWNGIGYATGRGPTIRAAVESATRKCHAQTGVPAGAHVRACSEGAGQ